MKKIPALLLSICFSLLCSPVLAERINIATASSLRVLVEELGLEFQKLNPDAQFVISSASSGTLTLQIQQGAPFHLFFAASEEYVKFAKPISYANFGEAQLVVAAYEKFIAIEAIQNKKIAIANPATAPFGEAAWKLLDKHHLLEKNKIIRANNAQLALQLLERRMVDVAMVSSVQLVNTDFELLTGVGQGLNQQLALLKQTPSTKEFYDFVLSGQANTVLKNNGFSLIKTDHYKPERDLGDE